MAHFIGRALCCRLNLPPPEEDEPESPYAVMAARPADEDIEWSLDAEGNRAKSRSVTALQAYIREGDVEIGTLNKLTKSALEACPELGDFGVWTQQWDRQSTKFSSQRRGPSGAPTDAGFLNQMLADIEQVMSGNDRPSRYAWGPINNEEPVSLDSSAGDVQLTGHFLQERGLASRHMQEVLVRNGYEDTTFLVDLTKDKLVSMGLSKTLTSKAQMHKLMSEVKKLPRDHIPNLIPVNLLEWLRALRLARYDVNFERFGYMDGDLSLVVEVKKANLTAMGITVPAHVEKFLLAIQQLRALFGKGHVTVRRLRLWGRLCVACVFLCCGLCACLFTCVYAPVSTCLFLRCALVLPSRMHCRHTPTCCPWWLIHLRPSPANRRTTAKTAAGTAFTTPGSLLESWRFIRYRTRYWHPCTSSRRRNLSGTPSWRPSWTPSWSPSAI